MPTQQDFQETVTTYLSQLRSLFAPVEHATDEQGAARGVAALPAETLAERAETLADTSRRLGEMTAGYLEAEDRALREAAEMKLLAQATAEIEVARVLLEQASEENEDMPAARASRSSRSAALGRSIDDLVQVLETPLEEGVSPFLQRSARRAAAERPTDPERARFGLQDEAKSSLESICQDASAIGGRAVRDLFLFDAAALSQGVSLVSKDAAKVLDKAAEGLGSTILRLAQTGLRLLLQGYDWVLSLLGKDIEQQARQHVGKWIDDLKKERKEGEDESGLFGKLIDRIYTPAVIEGEVAAWVKVATADVTSINQTTDAVQQLAEKYRVKVDRSENLLKVVALAKSVPLVKTPQGQLVAAALTLGILGYVVYTGYDHVDSGRSVFGLAIPDRVEGIRETVQKALTAATAPG